MLLRAKVDIDRLAVHPRPSQRRSRRAAVLQESGPLIGEAPRREVRTERVGHHETRGGHVLHQLALAGSVLLQRAMTLEGVWRQVSKDRHLRRETIDGFKLVT